MEDQADLYMGIYSLVVFVVGLNALLGVIALEWAWSCTSRFRSIDKELASKFFAFNRYDLQVA